MVLDYINSSLKGNLNIEIEDIAGTVRTTRDGTVFNNVNRINSNKEILRAIPSIEVTAKYEHHALKDIEDEIQNGRPVIAWVQLPEGSTRNMSHSIVITDINRGGYVIYYNDPIFGEQQKNLGEFMDMWDRTDRILIKVKVGEREQRLLDEWIRRNSGVGS